MCVHVGLNCIFLLIWENMIAMDVRLWALYDIVGPVSALKCLIFYYISQVGCLTCLCTFYSSINYLYSLYWERCLKIILLISYMITDIGGAMQWVLSLNIVILKWFWSHSYLYLINHYVHTDLFWPYILVSSIHNYEIGTIKKQQFLRKK